MSYRIYYRGGRTHEGPEPRGENAYAVLAIVQDHPDVGVEIVCGGANRLGDYYVWRDGRWWAADINGLFQYLLDTGMVLFGGMTTSEEYREVMRQANDDKNGWLPGERKV